MQVILFQNIDKLGMQGDVVNVAPGYYRNYLGPRGIALEATAATLSRLADKQRKLRAMAEKQLGEASIVAEHLSKARLCFTMKATDGEKLFGSLHNHEIAEALAEQGFNIERRQIVMKDPIKTVGTHQVAIRLLGSVEASVTVEVIAEGVEESSAKR